MKIPKAERLSSGNYRIRLRLDGKEYSIVKKSKSECEHEAMLIKAQYVNGELSTISSVTLSEAIDMYIRKRDKVISPSSIAGYRKIQRTCFQSIMDKRIDRKIDFQRAVNEEATIHSAKTIKSAYGFIRAVLKEYGVDTGEVRLPQVVRNERPFLDPDQIKIFVESVKGKDCELEALLALHSLRRSEILALTKDDIKDGFIYVNKSKVMDESGMFVVKKTNKNSSSNRIIPIMIPRINELIEGISGDIVKGSPAYLNAMNVRINRVCKKNDLPLVGVHGLRHSFASLAYYLGLSEKETMMLGGWSDNKTMHSIYTHIYEKSLERKTNLMADFFKG